MKQMFHHGSTLRLLLPLLIISSYCCCYYWSVVVIAFSGIVNTNRREMMDKTFLVTTTTATTLLFPSNVSSIQPPPEIQGINGSITRVEGIGGGFDLQTSTTSQGIDVIYPISMKGLWNCQRIVTSVEGDYNQAEVAWRNLGGNCFSTTGASKKWNNCIESFDMNFIIPPIESNINNEYIFDGEVYNGVILDRGAEIQSRSNGIYKATWSSTSIDVLTYYYENNDNDNVTIVTVQRKVELPSEKGFGYDELYSITSSAGGIFADNKVQRAVRVKRRYRRAVDENGNRIVEGLEIMKTYRVLDGIAGIEMPTSTTKSQLKLRRY